MKQEYVVGFYFSGSRHDSVLLIEKQRPTWQKGRLNGVGGHVEPGELPIAAMNREFREETGIGLTLDRWEKFCELSGTDLTAGPNKRADGPDDQDFTVHFFTAEFREGDPDDRPMTDERLYWVDLTEDTARMATMLPNLRWLIPMCSPATRHDWPYAIREKST